METIAGALRKYLVMISVALVLILAASIFIGWLEKRDLPGSETLNGVASEAKKFAGASSFQGCLEEAGKKITGCEGSDLGCRITARKFLEVCIDTAPPSAGYCENFPKGDELAKTASFSMTHCKNHSELDIVVCQNTFEAVELYCKKK